MKKLFFSLLIATTIVATASAQETGFGFGPKVGVTVSSMYNSGGSSKAGVTAGVFADYRFGNVVALSLDIMYAREGAKSGDQKMKVDYLNMPLLINFYVVKGLALKTGIQPGIRLGAKNQDGTSYKDYIKNADFSIPVGISYLFNCGLILDARYNIGVTNVVKNDKFMEFDSDEFRDITVRNNAFVFTAGWRF